MMKKSIFLLLFIIPSCMIHNKKHEHACNELIPEDFYVRMQTNPEAVVLDTRIISEYAEERIPGARCAGNGQRLDKLVDSLSSGRMLLIYCDYEDRSSEVCKILTRERHFGNVYMLKGGYNMWKKVNLPVDTSRRQVY